MSKIRYATLFVVVLVGCSRENESKIEPNVSVQRKIGDLTTKQWSMTLRPRDLTFFQLQPSVQVMSFSGPKEATDALAKFVEWDEIARQNKVGRFSKKLTDKCTFEFAEGRSTLKYFSLTETARASSGEFSRADVDKFNELMKDLPAAKAELEDKIAKAKKEAALFK